MLSRRKFIGKAAVGAVGALALGAARTGIASTGVPHAAREACAHGPDGAADVPDGHATAPPPADAAPIASPPPWQLVSPLAAGAMVAAGWHLAELSPVRDGSCVATLQNESKRSHRIHLCRNDGTPQGLVYTRRLDLVVMNGGQGDLPTEEGLAQAVAALAHTVAANEAKAADQFYADLLPHQERVRRFAVTDGTPAMEGKLR
jgi:hypothetical protein